MVEVGSVEGVRDPEVRALRARFERAGQEPGILKKALVLFGQPTRGAPPRAPPNGPPRRYSSGVRAFTCPL